MKSLRILLAMVLMAPALHGFGESLWLVVDKEADGNNVFYLSGMPPGQTDAYGELTAADTPLLKFTPALEGEKDGVYLKSVAASFDGDVWGIGSDTKDASGNAVPGPVYHRHGTEITPRGDRWEVVDVPQGITFKQLAVNAGYLFALDTNGDIYQRVGFDKDIDGTEWKEISDKSKRKDYTFTFITVGPQTGRLWALADLKDTRYLVFFKSDFDGSLLNGETEQFMAVEKNLVEIALSYAGDKMEVPDAAKGPYPWFRLILHTTKQVGVFQDIGWVSYWDGKWKGLKSNFRHITLASCPPYAGSSDPRGYERIWAVDQGSRLYTYGNVDNNNWGAMPRKWNWFCMWGDPVRHVAIGYWDETVMINRQKKVGALDGMTDAMNYVIPDGVGGYKDYPEAEDVDSYSTAYAAAYTKATNDWTAEKGTELGMAAGKADFDKGQRDADPMSEYNVSVESDTGDKYGITVGSQAFIDAYVAAYNSVFEAPAAKQAIAGAPGVAPKEIVAKAKKPVKKVAKKAVQQKKVVKKKAAQAKVAKQVAKVAVTTGTTAADEAVQVPVASLATVKNKAPLSKETLALEKAKKDVENLKKDIQQKKAANALANTDPQEAALKKAMAKVDTLEKNMKQKAAKLVAKKAAKSASAQAAKKAAAKKAVAKKAVAKKAVAKPVATPAVPAA